MAPVSNRRHSLALRSLPATPNAFEPGTFAGDQVGATIQAGDDSRGVYGGSRISYDFTNRFVTDTEVSRGRLINSRSYIGYAWDTRDGTVEILSGDLTVGAGAGA